MQAQLFHFRQVLNKVFSNVCCHMVAVVIILCSAGTNAMAQSTIAATATQPNMYGGCIDSIFTLQYYSPSAHTLTIAANHLTQQQVPNNCDGQQGTKPQVVIIFDTIIGYNTNVTVDSVLGVMICNITAANDTVKLNYRVLIDCSVASNSNFHSTVTVQEVLSGMGVPFMAFSIASKIL